MLNYHLYSFLLYFVQCSFNSYLVQHHIVNVIPFTVNMGLKERSKVIAYFKENSNSIMLFGCM